MDEGQLCQEVLISESAETLNRDGDQKGTDEDQHENKTENTTENTKKRLSRSERKRKRHEELLQYRKETRKMRKITRKQRHNTEGHDKSIEGLKSKREQKKEVLTKCEAALQNGQKICIDCSLEDQMSPKEKGKLAMQFGRLYGSNKKAENPAHIYLTGLKKDHTLHNELVKKNCGFLNYLKYDVKGGKNQHPTDGALQESRNQAQSAKIDVEEKSHTELFPLDKIVVLSPDSDNVLTDIEPDKVYVIGGLVDENITKDITSSRAKDMSVQTARLPIEEYMMKLEQQSHSKVLAVNQVFDILLTYISTRNWKTALAVGVPKRKGFIVKDEQS